MLGHSAVKIERGDRSLVIDPGAFSDLGALGEAEAVLISHGHPDHLAAGVLDGIAAHVWAPEDVAAQLLEAGIDAARIHPVEPGESFVAAGLEVRVLGGEHAEVYPGLPRMRNNAYLVEGETLHTGDSHPVIEDPAAVRTLLLPVAAPWLKLADSIDYARGFEHAIVRPMHDAILSDAGKQIVDGVLTATLGAETYQRLAAGVPIPL
jgi:L-ascorbate metabolism protein UlaG (beta-lactamase superfamily)